ncbi:MAG TPA: 30S ribosomal protein S4 [Candidatus Saccharimonadales bacterium]|nr:30S ribosomal protein S4 [Candidatus Saccharimonadales bacterium]
MARDTSSIVKMSRREGYALHPRAHKVLIKRSSPPGGPKSRPSTPSQYAQQLREKQKVKRLYGLLEKQFANLMSEALSKPGPTGELLLEYLERRLDSVIYRAGFAKSRRASRQLSSHGHFKVNDVRVNVPSIRLKPGDVVELKPTSKANSYFKEIDELSPAPSEIPKWISVDRKKFKVSVSGLPKREDAEPDINEQLIVEYYSR